MQNINADAKPIDVQELLELILTTLDMNKAEDIQSIDLKGKTDIADHMVVASGTSKRHVMALTDYIIEKLKTVGIKDAQTEGTDEGDWVLLDAGDVIVHIFRPEVREFYKIEDMWQEVPTLLSRKVSDI